MNLFKSFKLEYIPAPSHHQQRQWQTISAQPVNKEKVNSQVKLQRR